MTATNKSQTQSSTFGRIQRLVPCCIRDLEVCWWSTFKKVIIMRSFKFQAYLLSTTHPHVGTKGRETRRLLRVFTRVSLVLFPTSDYCRHPLMGYSLQLPGDKQCDPDSSSAFLFCHLILIFCTFETNGTDSLIELLVLSHTCRCVFPSTPFLLGPRRLRVRLRGGG